MAHFSSWSAFRPAKGLCPERQYRSDCIYLACAACQYIRTVCLGGASGNREQSVKVGAFCGSIVVVHLLWSPKMRCWERVHPIYMRTKSLIAFR